MNDLCSPFAMQFARKEIHIVRKFDEDFYGKELRAIALEYIRPELNFKSLGKSAIHNSKKWKLSSICDNFLFFVFFFHR